MTEADKLEYLNQLRDNPLLFIILSDMESMAIDRAVQAGYSDDRARQSNLIEVSVIRNLVSNIQVQLDTMVYNLNDKETT